MSVSQEVNKLYELAYMHVTAKAVHIAVDLNIAGILTDGKEIKIAELANILDFDPIGLHKWLLLLEANEIVVLDEHDNVKPTKYTPLLGYLDSPHIGLNYKTLDSLQDSFKYHKAIFSEVYGEGFYPYLQNHQLLEKFRIWCTDTAKLWLPSILNIYDFSTAGKIADLGGGEGYLLGMILSKYKHIAATLLDQKDVVEGAKQVLNEYGVYGRVAVMVGDFLKPDTLPKDHDTYILCRTLLNWSDEDCRTIINNCCQAMKSGSKLLIIDFFIPEKTNTYYKRALLSDTVILATFRSSNRTLPQWKTLAQDTKLKINNVFTSENQADPEPIMPFCVIELEKAIRIHFA
jgi:hypothetical protein